MPVISNITWETYKTNQKSYLVEDDSLAVDVLNSITNLLQSLDDLQGFDKILEDKQLFIINGVSPLNQLSINLQSDINKFVESVSKADQTFGTEATDHIGSEKLQTLYKVEEKYTKDYLEPLSQAVQAYNLKSRKTDYDDERKIYKTRYYDAHFYYSSKEMPSVRFYGGGGNKMPPASVQGDIPQKLADAKKFYTEYVEPAKKLQNKKASIEGEIAKANPGFWRKLYYTIDATGDFLGKEIGYGTGKALESLIDFPVSLVARIFNSDSARKWVEKDRIGDRFSKTYGEDYENYVEKYGLFKSNGKAAKVARTVGNITGYAIAAIPATIALTVGLPETVAAASLTLPAIGSQVAVVPLLTDMAIFGAGGLAEGTEYSLQQGEDIKKAFNTGAKQGAYNSATVAAFGFVGPYAGAAFKGIGKAISKGLSKTKVGNSIIEKAAANGTAKSATPIADDILSKSQSANIELTEARNALKQVKNDFNLGKATKEDVAAAEKAVKEARQKAVEAHPDNPKNMEKVKDTSATSSNSNKTFQERVNAQQEKFEALKKIPNEAKNKVNNTVEKLGNTKPVQKTKEVVEKGTESLAKRYDKLAAKEAETASKPIDINNINSKQNKEIFDARTNQIKYENKAEKLKGTSETVTEGKMIEKTETGVPVKTEKSLTNPSKENVDFIVTEEGIVDAKAASKVSVGAPKTGEALANKAGYDTIAEGERMVVKEPEKLVEVVEPPVKPAIKPPKTNLTHVFYPGIAKIDQPYENPGTTPAVMPESNIKPPSGTTPSGGGGGGYTSYPSNSGGSISTGGGGVSTPTTPTTPAPAPRPIVNPDPTPAPAPTPIVNPDPTPAPTPTPTPIVNPDPVPTPSNPIPKSTTSPDQVIENVSVPNTGLDKNISFADIAVPIGLGAATIGSGAAVAKGIKDYKEEKEDKDKKDDREEKE